MDLLLECNFSYMQRGGQEEEEENEQKPQLLEDPDDEFLSPLIGPEGEEDENEEEVGNCS